LIEEGQSAPTFSLQSASGEQVSLESLRGKPIVLYFYPKDDSRSTKNSQLLRAGRSSAAKRHTRRQ